MKILLLFWVLLLLSPSTESLGQTTLKSGLPLRDKTAIIQAVMEMKLKSEGPLKFSEYLVFSSSDMSPALIPKIPGFHFELMTPSRIRRRERRQMVFKYLYIGDFVKHGEFVRFDLGIVERRGALPYHSHVYQYGFSRIGNKWQGKVVMVIC